MRSARIMEWNSRSGFGRGWYSASKNCTGILGRQNGIDLEVLSSHDA
jgi:hypothetical protein